MTDEPRTPSPDERRETFCAAPLCDYEPRHTQGAPGCYFAPSDHCGIVEVDPADFDPFAPTAKTAFAKGIAYARKVSQRHAKHGARK